MGVDCRYARQLYGPELLELRCAGALCLDLAKLTRIDRVFQFAQIIEQTWDVTLNNAPQRVVVDSQVAVY